MKLKKKSFFLENLTKLILIATILLNSNSFFVSAYSSIGVYLSVVSIILLFFIKNGKIKASGIISTIICLMYILLNCVIIAGTNYIGTSLRLIIVLIFSIIVSQNIEIKEFIKKYINVMVIITLFAIIIHLLINNLGYRILLNYFPKITNANGVTCHSIILYNVYTYRTDRLMGPFWEPSIFSSFACIAMLFEICFKKKTNYINLLILIFGIILSKSTGGYVLLILLMIIIILDKMQKGPLKNLLILALIFLLGICTIYIDKIYEQLYRWSPEVFYKLDINQQSGSLITRTDSAKINLNIFKGHPIFGVGFGKVEGIYKEMGGKNETSTITYFLAAFGFVGLLYTIYLILAFLKQKKMNIIFRIIFALFFLIIVCKEPYWFSTGMYIIILTFYNQNISLHEIE